MNEETPETTGTRTIEHWFFKKVAVLVAARLNQVPTFIELLTSVPGDNFCLVDLGHIEIL